MTFTFNPPPSSQWDEAQTDEPKRLPYALRREVRAGMLSIRKRNESRRVFENGRHRTIYDGPTHYYYPCKRANSSRARCPNEIEVYRVVTGTRQLVQDFVYYWPDTAIVLETGREYGVRTVQHGFCSWKCLSLWSAKVARDTE